MSLRSDLAALGLSIKLTPMETEGSWSAIVVRTNPDDEPDAYGLVDDHRLLWLKASSINPNNALRILRVKICRTLEGMA